MFVTLHTNVIVVTIRISTADLIGGGGNTDVCPGRRTPSRRHWIWSKITSLLPYTYSIYPRRPISVTFMSCQTDSYFSPNITPRAHRTIYATFLPITSHADFHKKNLSPQSEGNLTNALPQIYYWVWRWKNFENQSKLGEITAKESVEFLS